MYSRYIVVKVEGQSYDTQCARPRPTGMKVLNGIKSAVQALWTGSMELGHLTITANLGLNNQNGEEGHHDYPLMATGAPRHHGVDIV